MKRAHAMPFGAEAGAGGVRFRLWAPAQTRVALELDGSLHGMNALPGGWHELFVGGTQAGSRYRYVLEDGLAVPDPASRANPDDVHGTSQVIDPLAYPWRDAGWRGRPWHEAVVYELHLGTFTPEGTFAAARGRLAELAALGITAIELMPVADFPGRRNWGYDGVLPFAPDACYGTPDELKALVDEAHALGLMVLLDVVYNHFGPEGNYLHATCPEFFNPAQQTPWGAAINFDGADCRTVREFFVHNALYWLEEFHFDGLRLDAVHAIRDDSRPDIVCEIGRALREGPGRERHVHVVLENDKNEAHYLGPCASAQWNDDLHHAAHVLLAKEVDGYYADYAERPLERLGRALAEGFVYQGEPSAFRDGELRGEPSAGLPPSAFVSFLQTHDQVGNRAFGERLDALAAPGAMRTALAAVLLSPHVPMLFMGEEFAAATPFQFFCDFGPELAAAVTRGRRGEFARFAAFRDPAAQARIPDPNAEATFLRSKLDWSKRDSARLSLVRELLAIRQRHLAPRLAGAKSGSFAVTNQTLLLSWPLGDGSRLHMQLRFDGGALSPARGELLYGADGISVALERAP
ncbi:MAG TPA: malto-oligosyltrehalose trehalohydrolase [Burkholderiales bacterium]|nr:malto-oligosyltrehalose trehalohydrolase [Burkholderiales bacterium]